MQSRIMQNVSREMEIKEVQTKTSAARDARRVKLQMTRDQLVESRRQVASKSRDDQKKHEMSAGNVRVEAEQINRSKAHEARKRKEELKLKQEEERRVKALAIQQEVQKKITAEQKKRLEAEKIISSLENEEKVLIARLKKTQEMQEKVRNNGYIICCVAKSIACLHVY